MPLTPHDPADRERLAELRKAPHTRWPARDVLFLLRLLDERGMAIDDAMREARAEALIRFANEQREDDKLRDEEIAEAERRGAENMRGLAQDQVTRAAGGWVTPDNRTLRGTEAIIEAIGALSID